MNIKKRMVVLGAVIVGGAGFVIFNNIDKDTGVSINNEVQKPPVSKSETQSIDPAVDAITEGFWGKEVAVDREHIAGYADHCIKLIEEIPLMSADEIELTLTELVAFRMKFYQNEEDSYSQLFAAQLQCFIDSMVFNMAIRNYFVRLGQDDCMYPFGDISLLSQKQVDKLFRMNSYKDEEVIARIVKLDERFQKIYDGNPEYLKKYVSGRHRASINPLDYPAGYLYMSSDFINDISDTIKYPFQNAATLEFNENSYPKYALAYMLESIDNSRKARRMVDIFRETDHLIGDDHDPVMRRLIGDDQNSGELPKLYSLKTFYSLNDMTTFRVMNNYYPRDYQKRSQYFKFYLANYSIMAPFSSGEVIPNVTLSDVDKKALKGLRKNENELVKTTADIINRLSEIYPFYRSGNLLPEK